MRRFAFIVGSLMLLASCGSSDKDRAVSGAGIGAGLGTTVGLVAGGPFAGLVLGGAFGAATGLVTEEETIDLGEPVWGNDDDPAADIEGGFADRTGANGTASSGDEDEDQAIEFEILD